LNVSGETVALEAMAGGVSAVVAGTPGFDRYVRHEETVLVMQPDDVSALAAAVR
jgi:glycosyltransferase involved in cell wall biosynthesis